MNGRTVRVSYLGGKIICGKCGSQYRRFKIHPDWYGGRWAWCCKNKYRFTGNGNKRNVCHIYDDNIHHAINVAAFEVLAAKGDLIAYVSKITGITSRKIN